jgi:tetratricopeptide (TPR) repeat protein
MAKKKKAKKKPLAKGKATSSPLTKAQVKGFEETAEANKTLKVAICIFLMVATFCIYSQVQDHEFINLDDDIYITNNLNVQAGLTSESFKWAFTTSHPPYWHPMTWLSHMLDYQLYGLHPKGHYLTNLFLHISSVLILFIVLFRMTGALWQSAFVAAMFALHPLNVESVAWIAERKNVLSILFWLLTMWAYIHYAEKPTVKRYGLVFLFFTLGLMSKPMLVTLPFVLLLLDYWPLRRFQFGQERGHNEILEKNTAKRSEVFRLVLEKIPLFLLTIGLSIVTVHNVQSIAGAVTSLDVFPLQARLTNAIVSYLEYLEKMIWPSGLSILYPHPGNTLPLWQGILCGMALVGITIISIRLIRKAPYFAVGWFWYLGTLVPVIGIVQVGAQAMADRFTYIPLIGVFIIVAWGVPELISKWRHKEKVLSVSAGIIIFTLLITTWKQASHWKNSITVFKHAIRVTDKKYPTLSRIHNNLGIALYAEGKKQEAISHYKMAIKFKPDYAKAYSNLGAALFAEQKTEEAISQYKMAIELNPDFAKAYNNLGNALSAEGKIEEAIDHYKMAIKIKPDYALAHNNLGIALVAEGKIEEAISHFKMAIKVKPNFAEAYSNLGSALSAEGKIEEAISHYKMAIKIKPNFAKAHYNLGIDLVAERKIEEAISHFKMAIKIKPDYAAAYNNLGAVLFNAKMTKEAINSFKEAIRIRPGFAEAQKNLEAVLLRSEELE